MLSCYRFDFQDPKACLVLAMVVFSILLGLPAEAQEIEGLSTTWVGGLEAGETGRLAVSWEGDRGVELSVWVDFDGDGSFGEAEVVADGAWIERGIEVFEVEVPGGVVVDGWASVRVRIRKPWERSGREVVQGLPEKSEGCEWAPGFHVDGSDWNVESMIVYDDGNGSALYIGGYFNTVGNQIAKRIAKWNGDVWSSLGEGMNDAVFALTAYNDGSGSSLYAAGRFSIAGGVAANGIAKWDGSSWHPLGPGLNDHVHALTVYDDGSGPSLYAAGRFTAAGEETVSRIAKWDGSSWSPLGTGMNDLVLALAVHDDGSGEALYAGGDFTVSGGISAKRIAKWDGSSWSSLGEGMDNRIHTLAAYNDGNDEALYAGGDFTTADGFNAHKIAKWDGSEWTSLGPGTNRAVYALKVYDDGNGAALYASGGFDVAGGVSAGRIAKWDGSSWSPLGPGMNDNVQALAVYDDGDGAVLYAGGVFTVAGGIGASRIAKWDGSAWRSSGLGGSGASKRISSMAVYESSLYAGGRLDTAGGVSASMIAKWDGSSWSPLGSGVGSRAVVLQVAALAVHDDGSGEALFVGGHFISAGGVDASMIAKWDGSSWSSLSTGMDDLVSALAVYDDGSGAALYAGGDFTTAGGMSANRIAKWDGSSWSSLSTGMDDVVLALAVYDDGSGAALYAGGDFTTAGGMSANRIAKWDGFSWSALGTGMDDWVSALAVYDDGSDSALYAGGDFTAAGEVDANMIAKWDGASWSPLGTGMSNSVIALAVYDDGDGSALYVGGYFASRPASRIAKWDGSAWSPLGAGTNNLVSAMAVYDSGSGSALYAGGNFFFAGGAPSSRIARWACPTTFRDPVLTKTNNATKIIAGEVTTYTITVTNPTSADIFTATLTDAFAPDLACSWTSTAEGGATGNTAGSGSTLEDTLSLPANSSVTYTVACEIPAGATGEITNTATLFAPGDSNLDNNVAVDTDPILQVTDLGTTLTNGTDEIIAGGTVTYSLAVTNHGPSDTPAAAVQLTDAFPPALNGCHWRGTASGGALGHTSGAGDALGDTLTMPAGSTVSYVITCAVPATVSGTLVHTATVTTPSDPDPANNTATDSDPVITRPAAKTVILTHFHRMQSELALTAGEIEPLLERLHAFADHPSVQGLVVDLGYAPDLPGLYDAWDADVADGSSDPELANRVLFGCHDPLPKGCSTEKQGIHDIVRDKLASHPDVSYLMLIGDDRIFPMARIRDFTRFPSENDYTPLAQEGFLPGLTASNTTVGQAAARNRYLSDDLLGVRGPVEPAKLDFLFHFDDSFTPDLAVGRLVETPQEILYSLDVFLARDGLLDLTSLDPDHRVLVTGYDFLIDSGQKICRRWKRFFGQTPLCPDDNLSPVDGELLSRTWNLFTAAERADALYDHLSGQGLGAYGLINLNGHATHYEEGVPGHNPTDIQGLDASRIATLDLQGSVIYAVGCHGGLPVAGDKATKDDHPLDLPQAFLRRGALAYIANSGFGWGLFFGSGYSERLMEIFTQELSRGDTVTIGDAVLTAKNRYFLETPRDDRFDVKTTFQWTLFGFPMAAVRTGLGSAPFDPEEGAAVLVESSFLRNASGTPNPDYLEPVGKDFDLTADGLFVKNTASGEEVGAGIDGCPHLDGCFYTLNGLATGAGDLPIEPFFIKDSRLSGTSQHGILWKGGRYEEEEGWKPVLAQPTSSGGALDVPSSLPRKTFIRPRSARRPGSLAGPNCRPTDTEQNVFVFTPAELLFDENLEPTLHRLHREVELEVFYYNNPNDKSNCDRNGPQFLDGPYHELDGSTVRFSVPVDDEGGVWRVVVVWDDEMNDRWRPLELAVDAVTGRWVGELPLPADLARMTYFLQAVDTRGNVSWAEFVPPVEPESGIEPQLPLLLEAVAPPSGLIFEDGFETGGCSRWSSCP